MREATSAWSDAINESRSMSRYQGFCKNAAILLAFGGKSSFWHGGVSPKIFVCSEKSERDKVDDRGHVNLSEMCREWKGQCSLLRIVYSLYDFPL